eukprot:gene14117-biopygen9616
MDATGKPAMARGSTWSPAFHQTPGRNGHARVRSASVSLSSIVRPASGPRPPPHHLPASVCAASAQRDGGRDDRGGGCRVRHLVQASACTVHCAR